MDPEASSDIHKRPAAKNPSAKNQGRKRVKSVTYSSSDGARKPRVPVKVQGLSSSDSEPRVPVKVQGPLSSSDSEPRVRVKVTGLSSSGSEPRVPVEMVGHSSSGSEPRVHVQMKGNSYGDDSSSYESYSDSEFEEDFGSMHPVAESVEPDLSEAEIDAISHIDIDFNKLSELNGELVMGEISDDVLYGKEVDGRELTSKILELIRENGASVLKDAVHYFKTPSKTAVFDSTLGYYVMKKPSRSGFSTMSFGTSPQYVCLLHHVLNLIREGTKKSPHTINYGDEALYKGERKVKAALDALCLTFECTRSSLRIVSGSKGFVVGPLEYRRNDEMIYCTSRQIIPTEDDIPNSFQSDALWILVVEKDTVFQRLETPHFWKRYRCILITGKGQANVSTRMFVQSLRRNLKLPVFVLADCNPSGFTIMSTYRHGAEKRAFENHRMAVRDIKWIGLHPTDEEKYNLSNKGDQLSEDDIKSLNGLLMKQCVNEVPGFKSQLEYMLKTKKKYQLEHLGTSLESLISYILAKLEIKDWI